MPKQQVFRTGVSGRIHNNSYVRTIGYSENKSYISTSLGRNVIYIRRYLIYIMSYYHSIFQVNKFNDLIIVQPSFLIFLIFLPNMKFQICVDKYSRCYCVKNVCNIAMRGPYEFLYFRNSYFLYCKSTPTRNNLYYVLTSTFHHHGFLRM